MWNKIKKFLEDRGWYDFPKWMRHTGGSAILILTLSGIQQMLGMSINWPLSGLLTIAIVLWKELAIDKTKWPTIMKEMLLTFIVVALAVVLFNN